MDAITSGLGPTGSANLSRGGLLLAMMQQPPHSARIDTSLARGIRRSYFRTLAAEWDGFRKRVRAGEARNISLGAKVKNERQLRQKAQLLNQYLGKLIPASDLCIQNGSRGADIVLGIMPDPFPQKMHMDSDAHVQACVLYRSSGYAEYTMPVRITAHAVDRVAQRSRMVDLPVHAPDIQAINAEFADALTYACAAATVLQRPSRLPGGQSRDDLNVLLPGAHGVFLARWSEAEQELVICTFVDSRQLNNAQREAIQTISEIGDGHVSLLLLDSMAPGWMGFDTGPCREALLEAWVHFGWRFQEDRLHPGMSDRAWSDHH